MRHMLTSALYSEGSYNKINGTYACENDKALNGLLKGELNFQGKSRAPSASEYAF